MFIFLTTIVVTMLVCGVFTYKTLLRAKNPLSEFFFLMVGLGALALITQQAIIVSENPLGAPEHSHAVGAGVGIGVALLTYLVIIHRLPNRPIPQYSGPNNPQNKNQNN